jgi:hypothetical protein
MRELLQNALPKDTPIFRADGSRRILRNVLIFPTDYTASHPKRQCSSY